MFGLETLATTYGLASALAWGASDFSGGYVSRKADVLLVVFRSQAFGGAFLLLLALSFSSGLPPLGDFVFGGLAGAFGLLGLVAFYVALARGRMSVVAPISALVTTILPVLFSLFTEGLPGPAKLAGFGFALGAVWFLSQSRTGRGFSYEETVLPTLAGIGFGLFFVFIDQATSRSVLWPLVGGPGGLGQPGGRLPLLLPHPREALPGRDAPDHPGRAVRCPGQPLLRPGRQPGPVGRLGRVGLPLSGGHGSPGLDNPQGAASQAASGWAFFRPWPDWYLFLYNKRLLS